MPANPSRKPLPKVANLRVMWLIGGPIVGFFLIGGIAFWILLPGIWIGQIWVAVSLLLLVIYGTITRLLNGKRKAANELRNNGLPGRARILDIEATGLSVNHRPQLRLRLQVHVAGKLPYEVTVKELMPHLGFQGQRSDELVVYVDRDDPQKLMVDWTATPVRSESLSPAQTTGSVADRLKELDGLQRQGLVDEQEYEAQRQRILASL